MIKEIECSSYVISCTDIFYSISCDKPIISIITVHVFGFGLLKLVLKMRIFLSSINPKPHMHVTAVNVNYHDYM